VINSQDQNGKVYQRVLVIIPQPSTVGNQSVNNAIKQASDFCDKGKVRDAEQILQELCGQGHIVIHETKPASQGQN